MPVYLSDTALIASGARYGVGGTAVSPSRTPMNYSETALASIGKRVNCFGTANSSFETPHHSRGPTMGCRGSAAIAPDAREVTPARPPHWATPRRVRATVRAQASGEAHIYSRTPGISFVAERAEPDIVASTATVLAL